MNEQGYYRYPTISNDQIVFVCEDDLWSVPVAGGTATRLSASFGECSTPRLSPDGALLAFVSRDEGHPEVYLMPSRGGRATRLTFLGGDLCSISGWTPDGGEILFVSDANAWYIRETYAYAIAPTGGAPRRLNLGHMKSFALAPSGAIVLGRNEQDPARWKRYRGGTAGDLWIDADGAGVFRRLVATGANPVWPMWVGERVYFLDDADGVGNLYSCAPDGSELRRETNEREYYARFPSTDGRRIVYSAGGEIVAFDPGQGTCARVAIETPSAAPQTARRFVEASEDFEHFAPSPDGSRLALIARGQPFTMPYWEEAVTHYGTVSSVRYRQAEWLHDGRHVAVVSDAPGFERIEILDTDGTEAPRAVTRTDIGRVSELAASPVDDALAVANHRHELVLIDAKDGKPRVVDKAPGSRIGDLAFSADGRWLAYSWPVSTDTAIVRVVKVKSGTVHDVTEPLRVDRAPAWDPEGNYLYFISTRDFHPVYDALQFDLSFPQAMRPFVVTLRADVASPFVPKPRPIHKDAHGKRDEDEDEKERDRKPVRVEIDFEGISGRLLGFPVDEGHYEQIVAVKGRALFTQFSVKGIKPGGTWSDESDELGSLIAFDFDEQRSAVLQRDVGEIRLANDRRTLMYSSHEKLRAVDALADLPEDGDEPKTPPEFGRKTGWIDLSRASVMIEPRDEWRQMYHEAWRLQREHFWTEDMSAVDWVRVRDRYDAVLPRVRTRTELSDLIWEMQGELGTSHAYEIGGDHRTPPQYRRGFLGADLSFDAKSGGYRIERILRGDSWDRDSDSPLAEPGIDVREGDVILAVGGKDVGERVSPDELLVNAAGKEVTLTIRSRKGESRRVLVKTLKDEAPLRYRAWVDANRAYVRKKMNGRVGYIHIPDMGPAGFAEFHRGYLSEFNRDGLIVDVRYNRGGHVSPLLLEKLARKRVGYDVSRYGPPQPYPPESVGGAMVAVTNQFAGSDGDIFSHCFKLYRLGPLVGKRTWGGVIGINPYHRLVDGTITTQPEFSFWFSDVGWRVENYGTDPDYDVDIAPHEYREGRDPQLDFALELIEPELAKTRYPLPEMSTKPSLPLPTLG